MVRYSSLRSSTSPPKRMTARKSKYIPSRGVPCAPGVATRVYIYINTDRGSRPTATMRDLRPGRSDGTVVAVHFTNRPSAHPTPRTSRGRNELATEIAGPLQGLVRDATRSRKRFSVPVFGFVRRNSKLVSLITIRSGNHPTFVQYTENSRPRGENDVCPTHSSSAHSFSPSLPRSFLMTNDQMRCRDLLIRGVLQIPGIPSETHAQESEKTTPTETCF